MPKNRSILAVAAIYFRSWGAGEAAPLPLGAGEQFIALKQQSLTVFTYRPICREPSLLIVLHRQGRNADAYRDYARARRSGLHARRRTLHRRPPKR